MWSRYKRVRVPSECPMRPPKDNNATHQVCFRCTAGEHAELKRLAAVAGKSMSALLLDNSLGERGREPRIDEFGVSCTGCVWRHDGDGDAFAAFAEHICADHPAENLPEAESGE